MFARVFIGIFAALFTASCVGDAAVERFEDPSTPVAGRAEVSGGAVPSVTLYPGAAGEVAARPQALGSVSGASVGITTWETGTTATFTVMLASAPTANVTVTPTSSNTAEATVSGALTFTSANWSTAQTATVTGVDDSIADGPQSYTLGVTTSSSDTNYNGLSPTLFSGTNNDDDRVRVNFSAGGLTTTEAGGTAPFTLVLNSQPTANVTIAIAVPDATEATASPTSLTFTTANWQTPRTITLTGVDDPIADGAIGQIVTMTSSSSDAAYNALPGLTLQTTNQDNDVPKVVVTSGGLITTEAGGTTTFTVKLSVEPQASVTVAVSSTNTLEGTVSPVALTFTSANFATNQTVTITGVDDSAQDDDAVYTVKVGSLTSSDSAYQGLASQFMRVTNRDDDYRSFGSGYGTLSLLAGKVGTFVLSYLDGPAESAAFNQPTYNASSGDWLYISDSSNRLVRAMYLPSGEVLTLAGGVGTMGTADGTGSSARFTSLGGLAVDGSGNVLVADNYAIRRIDPLTRAVTTLAGQPGTLGSTNGTGTAARFNTVNGLATDGSGNLYVGDSGNRILRKVVIATGEVSTVAGLAGSSGSTDGVGTDARFFGLSGLTYDGSGALFATDSNRHTVRKIVLATAAVSTIAGSAGASGTADGTGTGARFRSPQAIASDGNGNLYVADYYFSTIRKVVAATGVVTTFAGVSNGSGSADGVGTNATFYNARGIAADGSGNLYVADTFNGNIRKIVIASAAVTTLTGTLNTGGTTDGVGSDSRFTFPYGIGGDGSNLYVTDYSTHTLRKIDLTTKMVSTLAGAAGTAGSADGTGVAAQFRNPSDAAVDGSGNLYVTDGSNHIIRRVVIATGQVTTVAGNGTPGAVDGVGTAARFYYPNHSALDSSGNLYVGDLYNNTVRKVVTATGAVTTFAGLAGATGTTDAIGTAARFFYPDGVAIDQSNGQLYVADHWNHSLRRIDLATGTVTRIAGTGAAGAVDGIGTAASFNQPGSITYDNKGNVYVADYGNNLVRKVNVATGAVTTAVGQSGLSNIRLGHLPGALYGPNGVFYVGGMLYITSGAAVLAAAGVD